MTDDDDLNLIVLAPETTKNVVRGSHLIRADCGCLGWASPATQAKIRDARSRILSVCVRHASEFVKGQPVEDRPTFHLTPEAIAEASAQVGADAVREQMQRLGLTERPIE